MTDHTAAQKLKGWITLARPEFHTVGVFPFALGAAMAWRQRGEFELGPFGWGTVAVMLVMLSTHLAGECFDHEEDRLSGIRGRSRFAGGTGVVPDQIISRRSVFAGSLVALVLAGLVGLFITFGYRTGPWTIPLGCLGMIGGFFYSVPPLRWASRGIGELWIGLCYGFLTVSAAYYLQTGHVDLLVLFVAVPIAATIFNVILANEYPDYESDMEAGKRNILVRVGTDCGARLYAVASAIGWTGAALSVIYGVPLEFLAYYSVPFAVSLWTTYGLLAGWWKDRQRLEWICGLGIAVNLGTSLVYILAFLRN